VFTVKTIIVYSYRHVYFIRNIIMKFGFIINYEH
jgi:hypothetical protein